MTAPEAPPGNRLGTASLLIAIAALLFVWSILGGVVLGTVAAAIGFAARERIKRGEANNNGVAVTPIVLGIVSIVVGLIFIPVWWRSSCWGSKTVTTTTAWRFDRSQMSAARHELQGQQHEHQGNDLSH